MTTLEELSEQIELLSISPEKIKLLEEAIKLTDQKGDDKQGCKLRMDLVECATFQDEPALSLTAFKWVAKKYDQHGADIVDLFGFHWAYKWVAGNITECPMISIEEVSPLLEDMKQKYQAQAFSLRPYYFYRYKLAKSSGNSEDVDTFFALWQQAEIDQMCCDACEPRHLATHYAQLGEYQKAIDTAQVILDKRLICNMVPHSTYATLLMPLYHLGDIDTAIRHQQTGYRMIKNNDEFLGDVGLHIAFLAHTDLETAGTILESKLASYLEAKDLAMQYHFIRSILVFFEKAADSEMIFYLPENFPLFASQVCCNQLQAWFIAEAKRIATLFDARNGNTYITDRDFPVAQ